MSLTVCQILAKPGSRQILVKIPQKEFHGNSSGGSWVLLCGQTNLTKLMVAFRKLLHECACWYWCCVMNYNRRSTIGPSTINRLFYLVAMRQTLGSLWPLLRAIVLHCQGTRAFFKIHVAYQQQLSFSFSLIVLQTLTLSISLYKHKKRNPSFLCSPS